MRELSHSRRRIAAATLNGRLPITLTGESLEQFREIDREKIRVDDANVGEALLEPEREARVEFHQRQRAARSRDDFLGQDAEAGTYLDHRVRF